MSTAAAGRTLMLKQRMASMHVQFSSSCPVVAPPARRVCRPTSIGRTHEQAARTPRQKASKDLKDSTRAKRGQGRPRHVLCFIGRSGLGHHSAREASSYDCWKSAGQGKTKANDGWLSFCRATWLLSAPHSTFSVGHRAVGALILHPRLWVLRFSL
jgi:hypothetical protein